MVAKVDVWWSEVKWCWEADICLWDGVGGGRWLSGLVDGNEDKAVGDNFLLF